MWPFDQRRERFRKIINDLEADLEKEDIKLHPDVRTQGILDRLALGGFLYSINGPPAHYRRCYVPTAKVILAYEEEDRQALEFLDSYVHRKSARIGSRQNPNYPVELQAHEEFQRNLPNLREQVASKIKEILDSEKGKIYNLVLNENQVIVCNNCNGCGSVQLGGIDHLGGGGTGVCPSCGGNGKSEYQTTYNSEQLLIYEEVRGELTRLERSLLPPMPKERLDVFARVKD